MSIFNMKLVDGETDYQAQYPFGVGAATGNAQVWCGLHASFLPSVCHIIIFASSGDYPYNSSIPAHVDSVFLDGGKLLGARVGHLVMKSLGR